MRIYLMRHAQAWWQVEPSHDWDTSLTEVGHEQARRTATWLAGHERVDQDSRVDIGAVVTSPLRRARQTAHYIAQTLALPVQERERLREATFHVASELPRATGPEQWPLGTSTDRYLAYRDQVTAGWHELLEHADTSQGPLLMVGHGGFIKTLFRVIGGTDSFCVTLYNACFNLVEWRRGRWHIVYVNLWDHLPVRLRTT